MNNIVPGDLTGHLMEQNSERLPHTDNAVSSACQISIPVARPVFSRFAAPLRSKPRPQPTSSTCSSPDQGIRFNSRSRQRNLPTLLYQSIQTAIKVHPMLVVNPIPVITRTGFGTSNRPEKAASVVTAQAEMPTIAIRNRFRTTPGASIP